MLFSAQNQEDERQLIRAGSDGDLDTVRCSQVTLRDILDLNNGLYALLCEVMCVLLCTEHRG